jgi:hypothetical protein
MDNQSVHDPRRPNQAVSLPAMSAADPLCRALCPSGSHGAGPGYSFCQPAPYHRQHDQCDSYHQPWVSNINALFATPHLPSHDRCPSPSPLRVQLAHPSRNRYSHREEEHRGSLCRGTSEAFSCEVFAGLWPKGLGAAPHEATTEDLRQSNVNPSDGGASFHHHITPAWGHLTLALIGDNFPLLAFVQIRGIQ